MTQPISVIAKSLVRERLRTGLSLAEIARRAARLLEPQLPSTQVIRRGEGTKVVAGQANYEAILLAACPPGARRDVYLLMTQPGADRISQPHSPGSVEHIIVMQGRALVAHF